MNRFLNRLHFKRYGFAIIELLIIVIIIGGMTSITVPRVTGSAEKDTVQKAMDTMMSEIGLVAVTAVITPTNDMAAFPDDIHPLYPDYINTSNTQGTYECNSKGMIEQTSSGYWQHILGLAD